MHRLRSTTTSLATLTPKTSSASAMSPQCLHLPSISHGKPFDHGPASRAWPWRCGGNSNADTVWREPGDGAEVESFVITPAAIYALAELLKAIDWRLIYGLNLARAKP